MTTTNVDPDSVYKSIFINLFKIENLSNKLIENSYLANKELAPIEDTKEMIKK